MCSSTILYKDKCVAVRFYIRADVQQHNSVYGQMPNSTILYKDTYVAIPYLYKGKSAAAQIRANAKQ